ncbi:MAG: type II toxin-antitoxin system VapC family toxin [Bacillota bacterium]
MVGNRAAVPVWISEGASVARAMRQGVMEDKDYREIVAALQNDWRTYLAMEVSDAVILLAGDLSEKHSLRGFDSIHLAFAETLKTQVSEEMVAACVAPACGKPSGCISR